MTQLHPMAELAAEAAEAAASQGKFWEMHDALFENQRNLSENLIINLAQEIELDMEKFMADLQSRAFENRVNRDVMSGETSDVTGTPSLFINGTFFSGDWANGELYVALRNAADERSSSEIFI